MNITAQLQLADATRAPAGQLLLRSIAMLTLITRVVIVVINVIAIVS